LAGDIGRQWTRQARSEQSVDDDRPRRRIDERHHLAGPSRAHLSRDALRRLAKRGDHDVMPARLQQTRGDHGIAAIIAGTGKHQD
jgi:hypothetical protein